MEVPPCFEAFIDFKNRIDQWMVVVFACQCLVATLSISGHQFGKEQFKDTSN